MKTTVEGHVARGQRGSRLRSSWREVRRRGSSRRGSRRQATSLGCLLVLAVLAGLPAGASASTPEMRGEWETAINNGTQTVHGKALISTEANGSGEFASSSYLIEGVDHGTFSGKIEGTTGSVKVTSEAYGPLPAGEFTSSGISVNSSGSSLSLSGSGTIASAGSTTPATFTATRIKTYKEVEEQHEREQHEREEAEARENVRGEWSLTLTSGPQTVHGLARITQTANAKNEFASANAQFESTVPGTFSGTLALSKATVKIETQAAGPVPASTFTSTTITVESHVGSMSMSGTGTLEAGGATVSATLSATRTKTYLELKQLEAKEKQEREAKEKQEREARERQEREAREAAEKRERENRERLEREAQLKQSTTQSTGGSGSAAASAKPSSTALTVAPSGLLLLGLSNPNAFAVQGRITLVTVGAGHSGKAATTKPKTGRKNAAVTLGVASFTISASGRVTVKLELSHTGRSELARHKTLQANATVVTTTKGKPSVSKTYRLTLRLAAPARRKH